MDQYASGSVQNALAPATASPNQYTASRRMFGNAEWWHAVSITVTDDAVTAPDGSTEASTFVATGNWIISSNLTDAVPAGTYTIAGNVKRNTGTDQSFCFTSDYTSSRSGTKTATSAWQRFSYTFTVGATTLNTFGLCSIDGATAANLQVCDLELFAGSSDLGPVALAGRLVLNQNRFSTASPYASGWVDLSAGGYGLIQLPSSLTISTFTAMAVVSKVASGSAYQAFLSKVQNYGHFSALMEVSGQPRTFASGGGSTYNQQSSALWTRLDAGATVIGCRYDGSALTFWLDGIKMFTATVSVTPFSLRDMFVGLVNSKDLPCGDKVNSIAFGANYAATDAEYRQAVTFLKARAALSGITFSTRRVYASLGDSITGAFSYAYPYLYGPNASPAVWGADLGVSGSGIADLEARAAEFDGMVPPGADAANFPMTIYIGANDLQGSPGASDAAAMTAFAARYAAFLDARRAANPGRPIAVATVGPISGNTTHNARRALLNPVIATWPGVHCTSIIDFAGNATMGTDTSFTDHPTDWNDGTHPSAAGQAIYETIARPVINAL